MQTYKSLADLIREGDAACPCWPPLNHAKNMPDCPWPGHAAIRAVVRKCATKGSAHGERYMLSALREVDGE